MKSLFGKFIDNVNRHDNFYDTLWLCHFVSDLAGLSVLKKYKPGELPAYKPTPYGLIFTTMVLGSILILNLLCDIHRLQSGSLILRHGMRAVGVANAALLLLSTLRKIYCRKSSAKSVLTILDFDRKLLDLGYKIDMAAQNRWFNRYIVVSMGILKGVLAIACYLTFESANGSWITFLLVFGTVSATNVIVTTMFGQIITLSYAFQYRFKALRIFLSELIPIQPETVNHFRSVNISKNRTEICDKITKTAKLYNQLVLLVDDHSRDQGLQLLLSHVSGTVFTIFSAFTMFRFIINEDQHSSHLAVNNFCWSLYYIYYMTTNTILSSFITLEAKSVGVVVHKAIGYCSDDTICNQFLLHENKRSPTASHKLINIYSVVAFKHSSSLSAEFPVV
ncbi:uncharacterized protein LOC129753618 [Uranotaenia lowii]|uniref:uncharacterized protein LOC129753618 n=1 Tax=Uranotaenia lowii TaxID=190385 RepID=UPI002479049B|nr:uncharacterized protein LOC129753618 [Uranotaenia lowii]